MPVWWAAWPHGPACKSCATPAHQMHIVGSPMIAQNLHITYAHRRQPLQKQGRSNKKAVSAAAGSQKASATVASGPPAAGMPTGAKDASCRVQYDAAGDKLRLLFGTAAICFMRSSIKCTFKHVNVCVMCDVCMFILCCMDRKGLAI